MLEFCPQDRDQGLPDPMDLGLDHQVHHDIPDWGRDWVVHVILYEHRVQQDVDLVADDLTGR